MGSLMFCKGDRLKDINPSLFRLRSLRVEFYQIIRITLLMIYNNIKGFFLGCLNHLNLVFIIGLRSDKSLEHYIKYSLCHTVDINLCL